MQLHSCRCAPAKYLIPPPFGSIVIKDTGLLSIVYIDTVLLARYILSKFVETGKIDYSYF